jgi:hypothetical protein
VQAQYEIRYTQVPLVTKQLGCRGGGWWGRSPSGRAVQTAWDCGLKSLQLLSMFSVVVEALCYKPEGHGFETR